MSLLQEQLKHRDRFFRMVIHDLRGPATSIQLGSEIVLKNIIETSKNCKNLSNEMKANRTKDT